jgi:hypothetical protein
MAEILLPCYNERKADFEQPSGGNGFVEDCADAL